MWTEEGHEIELALDFRKNGGKILEVSGRDFLIEVSSGRFTIPRNYVKRL
jgi:hypothetical protein